MADLKTKLARLGALPKGPRQEAMSSVPPRAPAPVAEPVLPSSLDAGQRARLEALRESLISMRSRQERPRVALGALPGELMPTEHGPLHLVYEICGAGYHHGSAAVRDAARVTARHLCHLALDDDLDGLEAGRLLFLDTETTGLAGGAGTLPFLIGLAWFEGEALHVEQLLLRRPGEEAPMLQRLAERLRRASGIVTFNGKTFDWPLLRNRFILNRVPCPTGLPHVDLLHCARRVFGRRPGPMRLTHLEREVLGFTRVGDIDGAVIPATYFAFLRGADPCTLAPVLTHNRHDVVALAALLGVLWQRLESPEACEEAADRLSVAHLTLRAGEEARALAFARAAARGQEPRVLTEA
ncbi:MAG TPA: ribonuclease H-like domain-containing protein, partial [Myxococcota bacterium]|nr:ribonuclease H-like domain-containing protein [Myxococcota bacterium]